MNVNLNLPVALILLITLPCLTFGYPFDADQEDLPEIVDLTGEETRTDGTVETYNIPIENWPGAITFLLQGGDGGRARGIDTFGSNDQIATGGAGAQLILRFAVDLTDEDALRPGGQLRFIVGSKGESKGNNNNAGAGGGGGTGLLYKAPVEGAEWELLGIAGGGGGGAASAAENYDSDGEDASWFTSGTDGGSSGGTDGDHGTGFSGQSGGGAGWTGEGSGQQFGEKGQFSGGEGGLNFSNGGFGGFGCGGGGAGYREFNALDELAGGGGGGGYSGGGAGMDGDSSGNTGRKKGGGGGGSYFDDRAILQLFNIRGQNNENGKLSSEFFSPGTQVLPGPEITLVGGDMVLFDYEIDSFSDPGASAVDVYGNTLSISSSVPSFSGVGIYLLVYRATDQFGVQSSETRRVQVISNTKPTFELSGDVQVNEDSGIFTQSNFAFNFEANDEGQSLEFYTVTTSDPSLFDAPPGISTQGTLFFTPKADTVGTVTVSVTATDDEEDDLNGTSEPITFTLTINGVDDPPENLRFQTSGSLERFLDENLIPAGQVVADEPFGEALTFEITGGNDQEFFEVDPDTGVLSFLAPPDYESPEDKNKDNGYRVRVRVTGSDGDDSEVFEVFITNVNETPTGVAFAGSLEPVASVMENAEAGDFIATLAGVDPDVGDTFSYQIAGLADSPFEIVGSTLRVTGGADIDFETRNLYEFTIRVQDAGGLSYNQDVVVNVTNQDEGTLSDFRIGYNLAEDGSEDSNDNSGNGVDNLFYYLFGLGDPSQVDLPPLDTDDPVQYGLPHLNDLGDGLLMYEVALHLDSAGYQVLVQTSSDLVTWLSIEDPSNPLVPIGTESVQISETHVATRYTFDPALGFVFIRVKAEVDTP